ncbi:hypothetical protein AAC387_Pa04g0660 [Persea americana]
MPSYRAVVIEIKATSWYCYRDQGLISVLWYFSTHLPTSEIYHTLGSIVKPLVVEDISASARDMDLLVVHNEASTVVSNNIKIMHNLGGLFGITEEKDKQSDI